MNEKPSLHGQCEHFGLNVSSRTNIERVQEHVSNYWCELGFSFGSAKIKPSRYKYQKVSDQIPMKGQVTDG